MSETDKDTDTRWYGRRQSHKLSPARKALVKNLLPKIRVPVSEQTPAVDLSTLFSGKTDTFWLEIGFGGGEHLAAQARNNPEIGIIGVEPFINGVASLLSSVDEQNLDNIRIYDDDVRQILDAIPAASLSRIFILFPDPWPKKRHNRRRLINKELLDHLSRILKDDGEFRFASDHKEYVSWTLERVTAHPDFIWQVNSKSDWTEPPTDWVETRYEAKGKRQGNEPAYLIFRRKFRA